MKVNYLEGLESADEDRLEGLGAVVGIGSAGGGSMGAVSLCMIQFSKACCLDCC